MCAWWTGQPVYGSNPVSRWVRENLEYLKTYVDYIVNSGVTTADLAAVHALPPSLASVVNITVNTAINNTDVSLGGGYNISGGIVLTITGAFSAPDTQIFFGAGTVAFGSGIIVNPRWFSTGAGTLASPWTGWATAITWTAGQKYVFNQGYYSYATAPNWGLSGIDIEGKGNVYLVHTGAGNGITLDGSGLAAYGLKINNFKLIGNVLTTVGLYSNTIHHSNIDNITILSMAAAGIGAHIIFNVCSVFRKLTISANEPNAGTMPLSGILLDRTGGANITTDCTFYDAIVEGVSDCGVDIKYGNSNTFIGGTSEGNVIGVFIDNWSQMNSFYNFYTEACTSYNYQIHQGHRNKIYSLFSNGNDTWIENGTQNAIFGGQGTTITVAAGASDTVIIDTATGGITDAGTRTTRLSNTNITTGDPLINRIPHTIEQEAWIAPALQNGWVDQGGGTTPAGYYKDTLGIVHLRGHIITGTFVDGTLLFTLPVGYRPSYATEDLSVTAGASALITGAGTVLIYGAAGAAFVLDGMEFAAF